ncbi:MAG TPA: SRPBCC domain-containing protein [Candidatus Limnocylindrales bacterium]|nr:SRPBCC domain-containing protein [Candidatus Limnocylindrales bacterium]
MAPQPRPARRRITIERVFPVPIEPVWELWTTRDGIESWWGPDGFVVKVRKLEVRRGGELLYDMTAIAPDQIAFMKKAGMPLTTPSRVTYVEVVPMKRLAFTQIADFIPGVTPYEVAHAVDFETTPRGVRMVLTLDAMHDERWTKLAVMGWENEFDKLGRLLKPV